MIENDGRRIALMIAAENLRPAAPMPVSVWAERNRRVPAETSQFPGRWSNATAPYLTEIMDVCGPDHPAERVTVIKSAQIGYSEALTNVIGAMIDRAPGPAMVVHPTVEAAVAWAAEKLDASIVATPVLRAKVKETSSRDASGSTTKRKRFPDGFLIIAGANSSRGLRQRSIRYLYKDDWDDWPIDVDGQGDPDKMAEARTTGWQSSGLVKIVEGTTPTDAATSRAAAAYERSDKRVYLVPCPHCAHEQTLRFFPVSGIGGLRWENSDPTTAFYACEECGGMILEHMKRRMIGAGRWAATEPGPGRHPGFQINALYSPFTTWSRIVARFLEAKDDASKLRVFYNLDLGEPWLERGDAPLWKDIQARAEDYALGVVPRGACVVTIGCDVQKSGIYYEVVAWGPNRETWSIGADFLEGETADPDSNAWKALSALYEAPFPVDGGEPVVCDMLAIDANYMTDVVCNWVRRHPSSRVTAVRGVDGWDKTVFGTASKTDVNFRGERKKRSAKIWPVYVWNLKHSLYADIRKGLEPGATPSTGRCHFPTAYGERFFTQLTADYLRQVIRRGRQVQAWVNTGANHFHDCRIYAMAAFHRAAQLQKLQWNDPAAWSALEARMRPPAPVVDAADPAPVPAAPAAIARTNTPRVIRRIGGLGGFSI